MCLRENTVEQSGTIFDRRLHTQPSRIPEILQLHSLPENEIQLEAPLLLWRCSFTPTGPAAHRPYEAECPRYNAFFVLISWVKLLTLWRKCRGSKVYTIHICENHKNAVGTCMFLRNFKPSYLQTVTSKTNRRIHLWLISYNYAVINMDTEVRKIVQREQSVKAASVTMD